jgi:hypothetical protein
VKVVPATTLERSFATENIGDGGQITHQMRPANILTKLDGKSKDTAEAGGCVGGASVKIQAQEKELGAVGNGNSASVLSKVPQNPMKSGVAAPNGDRESEGQGRFVRA